jgi:hypothetical protein
VDRPRHTDAQLVELARDGSAPAFGSLLHRHRAVLQRAALGAADPERAAELAAVEAMRRVRRGQAPQRDLGTWLEGLVREHADATPAPADVERLLPADWFDRVWVRVDRRWPTGRAPLRLPRWATLTLGGALLAVLGAGSTYAFLTTEAALEVVGELVAVPLEGTGAGDGEITVPGPIAPDAPPEEAPELFGDIEIGELPTYDLTGRDDTGPAPPSVGPPPAAPDPGGDDGALGERDEGPTSAPDAG